MAVEKIVRHYTLYPLDDMKDPSGFRILNMFDTAILNTVILNITELLVELADSAVESADSTTDSVADSLKISLWLRAFMYRQGG